jgi:type II secretory ATPase GspE/PulE/Tfp pilus assembly ATPase PilB-like protein
LATEKVVNERKIKELAIPQGIPTMREDGVIKILKGETSYEEVATVVDLYEE